MKVMVRGTEFIGEKLHSKDGKVFLDETDLCVPDDTIFESSTGESGEIMMWVKGEAGSC